MDRASGGRRATGRRTHLDERWETTSRGRFGKCGRAAAADARERFDSAALAIFLVFVFLLSKSKNSMAIWRRKVPIPPEIKAFYAPSLAPVVAALNRKYPIYLDEYVS